MRLRHTIYNSVGLGLAGIFAVSVLGRILILMRTNSLPHRSPGEYIFSLVSGIMVVFLVGGGGLANLVKGRLLPGPTIGMIVAYCVSIFLLPLGIWGILELLIKRRPVSQGRRIDNHARIQSSNFSPQFLRRAANLSWLCPAVGIVLAVICGSTHVRPLITLVGMGCSFVVVLSLILGIVALWGVREHGTKGILIPSIFGISISGLAILFVVCALIAGFNEGRAELRQQRTKMIESMGVGQTNAAPPSHTN